MLMGDGETKTDKKMVGQPLITVQCRVGPDFKNNHNYYVKERIEINVH